MEPPVIDRRLRFADFELDCGVPELWQGSRRIDLPLQPLRVLVLLASRPGQLVSSKEIARVVWENRVVSWPDSLHVCIRQLRRALGESAGNAGIIETVPRRGYRFIADVQAIDANRKSSRRLTLLVPALVLTLGFAIWAGNGFFRPASSPATPSPVYAAFEAYEKGAYLLARFPGGDLQLAASHFRNAVAADPTYVAAWAGLADTYVRLQDFDAAEPALRHALQLDPHSPEGLRIRGDLVLFRDWDLAAAEADYRQAIAADPDSAEGYQHLAMVLAATGQMALAIEQMEHALRIEPVSTIIRADLGWYYYLAGDYDHSIVQCRAALDIQPSLYFPHLCLLDAYVEQNRISDAVDQTKSILQAWGADPDASAGPADAALASFRRLYLELLKNHSQENVVSPMDFAYAYAGLGDASMTLHWLSLAFEERDPGALFAAVNPVFAFLQHRREFERLLQSHKIVLHTANGVADLPRHFLIEPDS